MSSGRAPTAIELAVPRYEGPAFCGCAEPRVVEARDLCLVAPHDPWRWLCLGCGGARPVAS
jgi:hypothetical protein